MRKGAVMRQSFSALIVCIFMSAAVASTAPAADEFPSRPIKLVVGFAPGGATDTVARCLRGFSGEELGQAIVVENVPGASGYLAWKAVGGAPADGYPLLMAENAIAIRPGFKDQPPPFDPVTQLDAVAFV